MLLLLALMNVTTATTIVGLYLLLRLLLLLHLLSLVGVWNLDHLLGNRTWKIKLLLSSEVRNILLEIKFRTGHVLILILILIRCLRWYSSITGEV
jgi:hypothetical protein